MVFSSNIFLFLFLPLFLGVYYLTPFRWKSIVILVGSYGFYAWWRVDFLILFVAVTLWNYAIGATIANAGIKTQVAKHWLIVGVCGNLLTLGYFKYADFGISSLNTLLQSLQSQPLPLAHVILPIGISFYIFQAISYIADVYRGDTEPTRRFVDFAAFIALFPQLIAGPVLRYKDLAHQFAQRTHTVDKFTEGATRFMQGFIKKVFIADTIAPLADNAFALQDPTAGDAWLGTLAYTAQLYFDFSGYSDMAIGLGLMMGFRFIENFNQPYISQSITEFWRRWHISLSSWLRDYLYIPLGGNRYGSFNTYRNLFLTMLLGGLWHGANWTFVVWGAWHGIWLSLERRFNLGAPATFNPLRWLFTFLVIMIGWIAFRSTTISEAFTFYQVMLTQIPVSLSAIYLDTITRLQIFTLIVAFLVIGIFGFRVLGYGKSYSLTLALRPALVPSLLVLFFMSVLKLSAESYSPFLYFQF